jgi:hypothetical protein
VIGRREDRVGEGVAVRVGRDERDRKRRVLVRRRALRGGNWRAVVVDDRAVALPVDDVAPVRVRQVDFEELVGLVQAVAGDVDGQRPARDARGKAQHPGCRGEVQA